MKRSHKRKLTMFSLSMSLNNANAQVLDQFTVSQPQPQAPAQFLVTLTQAPAHSTVSLVENHENASWSQLPATRNNTCTVCHEKRAHFAHSHPDVRNNENPLKMTDEDSFPLQ